MFVKCKNSFILAMIGTMILSVSVAYAAPMSFEQVLSYQKQHPSEISVTTKKYKDLYGNATKAYFFNFLGRDGVMHSGSILGGTSHRTMIQYSIGYFNESDKKPTAVISWRADLNGTPDEFTPDSMYISFSDGYVKTLPLKEVKYTRSRLPGLLTTLDAHTYSSEIILSQIDLYELTLHGNVASISIDDADDVYKHLFAGERDQKHKEKLTKAFNTSLKILDISKESLQAELKDNILVVEREFKDKVKSDIEAKAYYNQLRKEAIEEIERGR